MDITAICQKSKTASASLSILSTEKKNGALKAIAQNLKKYSPDILMANSTDIKAARQNNIPPVMIDRLELNEQRIDDMCEGIAKLISLSDPIGEVEHMIKRPNGLLIGKKRVPLGVIGIIFESRPNVTVDAATLCLKSSNAVILRGGKEAINTNIKLGDIMRLSLESAGVDPNCIQVISDTSRDTATAMMKANGLIDVLIPRGGAGLIASVVRNATIPVIETGIGNCHVYIDDSADLEMGVSILFNAKTSRPSVCNAAESLLVAKSAAEKFLPLAYQKLAEKKVKIKGCEDTLEILKGKDGVEPASQEDYATEFLDYILSAKVVSGVDEAIAHINKYGTGHSEVIVTQDYNSAQKFLEQVDAAAVYVNASSRFTDGFEFGMGAEIGISTQKLHARGPMGLHELTTSKYIIYGNGQIR